MKKVCILSVLIILAICLAACNRTPSKDPVTAGPATEPQATTPVTEPTIPDVEPVIENMYSISLPVTTEEYHAEDNTLLYTYSYQTIYPALPDRDVSDKLIMDFTNRIEQTRTTSSEILADAESFYTTANVFSPFSYEIQYDVTRIDQGVLSLYGHIIQISDSSPMSRRLVSANYNLVTGDTLTLGSILYHADTKHDLAALVISHLENQDEIMLYDEFRDTVKSRFRRDESQDEDFYFSATGLCFYFAPYESAPRAYGTVVVEIPYNKLTGIIDDAYFPAERSFTRGTMSINAFNNADLESYQQFVEIVAEPDSVKLLLTTDSAVQDIRINELVWAKDGLTYTQTKNIYASNFLYKDNAILFEAKFDEFRPNYMLSYSIEGSTYVFYLIKDQATGQITLSSMNTF